MIYPWRWLFRNGRLQITLSRPTLRCVAFGWWLDAYRSEASLTIWLGPISLVVWWVRGGSEILEVPRVG